MDSAFLTAYLLIDFFCVIFAGIILSKAGEDMGSEMEIRSFRRMIGCYLVFVVDDALWACCNTSELGLPHWLFSLASVVSAFSVATTAFYWFDYASKRMGVDIRATKQRIFVSQIPLLTLVVLYAGNLAFSWVFSISEAGEFVQGPLFGLAFACEASYLVPVVYMAGQRLLHAESPVQRREDLTLVSFIVIPTLGGVFDALVPGTPVMTPALFGSILYVFVSLQESRISSDALTGLNNRRRADAFIAERVARASEGAGFWFFIGDVDSFKQVNDRYGHLEGDHALCVMADALRMTAATCGGFTARWGGDEFVLVVDDSSMADPKVVIDALERHLLRRCNDEHLAYELHSSVGYAHCSSPADDAPTLLAEADIMLYEEKRHIHQLAA